MSSFQRLLAPLSIVAGLLPLAACSPTVVKPTLCNPGWAQQQRARAVQFDPYPQNDVGPEIVGGRPPDYAVPPNEVERAFQQNPIRKTVTAPLPVVLPPAPLY
jgi:hypothetical protein